LNSQGRRKAKRAYSPSVEALEALRLFSGAAATLPGIAALHGAFPVAVESDGVVLPGSVAAWDAALSDGRYAGLIAPAGSPPTSPADAGATRAGLAQLDRYLGRTWARAGIPPQQQDDSTQAVYLTLLQNLGRDRFDGLVRDIGRSGIPDVLSRETPEGPDFFRAIDMVKKRAQRERNFQALDPAAGDVAAPGRDAPAAATRAALLEAIARTLNPREAALIQATLQGETPAEIAQHWGVAPKTVSNEKTRAFQKLRDFLAADVAD